MRAALTEDFDRVRGVVLARDDQRLLEGRLQSHLEFS